MERSEQFATAKYRAFFKAMSIGAIHLVAGTAGVIFLSNVVISSGVTIAHLVDSSITHDKTSWLLTGLHGFPVQAVLGLMLGFVTGWHLRHRIMKWIWVLPLCFFILVVLSFPYGGSEIFVHFFGTGCDVTAHCFDQFLTLPVIACAGYSTGSAIAIRLQEGRCASQK